MHAFCLQIVVRLHQTLVFIFSKNFLVLFFRFLQKKLKMTSGVCCLFTETIVDDYTEFKPVQRTEMYLGFNRDGGAVSARYRTRSGARAFQFLKRPLPEDRPPDDESPEPYSWVHLLIQANTESSKDKTDSWWIFRSLKHVTHRPPCHGPRTSLCKFMYIKCNNIFIWRLVIYIIVN